MPSLCTNLPLPDFTSLYGSIASSITFPPTAFTLPPLPTLLNPMYSGFSNINLELSSMIQEFQNSVVMGTFKIIFDALVAITGGSLSAILPKIPGTSLNLLDLIAGSASNLYAAIQAAIIAHGLSIFPFVPDPMFSSMSFPSMETTEVVKNVVKGYFLALIQTLKDLITDAAHLLLIPDAVLNAFLSGLPVPPTSASAVITLLLTLFPSYTSIFDLLKDIDIQTILAFPFPGYAPLILPTPMFGNFSSFEIEFQHGMNVLYSHFIQGPLASIIDFVKNVLGGTLTFPNVCISF